MAKHDLWVHVSPDEFENGRTYRLMNYGKEDEDTPVTLIPHTSTNDVDGDLVGEANYTWFENNAADKVIYVSGGHGYRQVAIRADQEPDPEIQEAIDSLESYPLLDESLHSELEEKAREEAWADWGQKDFDKMLTEVLVEQGFDEEQVEELLERTGPAREAYHKIAYELQSEDSGHSEGDSWSFPFNHWKRYLKRHPETLAPLTAFLGGAEPPEWLRPF